MTLKSNSITEKLRNNFVSSRISKEIYFIECYEDLLLCSIKNKAYDLIRISVLLRILLLDDGIKMINKNYNINLSFFANDHLIEGTPLSNRKVKEIQSRRDDFKVNKGISFLMLSHEPLNEYSIEDFIEINCLKIKANEEYIFNVRNVINLVSNKHGASHLEPEFDLNTMESFMWGEFSPFSMKNDNFFLKKIKEITMILLASLTPLYNEVINNLIEYDSKNIQSSSSSFGMIEIRE